MVLSNNLLIPTDYDRDTVTLSYELRGDQHQGDVTLYNTETEIVRDESVMAPRWYGKSFVEKHGEKPELWFECKIPITADIG